MYSILTFKDDALYIDIELFSTLLFFFQKHVGKEFTLKKKKNVKTPGRGSTTRREAAAGPLVPGSGL